MMVEYKPIDHEAIRERIASVDTYWERQPTDDPHTLNGFAGTWAFSDHNLIPDALRDFIWYSFPKVERFRRIPLEDINALMNEVWEGPGSMPKIMRLKEELRVQRLGKNDVAVKTDASDRTIDDYDENEFSVAFGEEDE